MHDFKKMKVWQKARELAKSIYIVTSNFPKEEIFGLTSQTRRSAVSIVSNIAEGSGRNTDGEFINFLGIALGSVSELEAQSIIANDLSFLNDDDLTAIQQMTLEIQKMLYVIMNKP
jgi:four helix bundle protein